jgi:hypothetical protein
MIKITLKFGGDVFEAIIRGNELFFSDVSSGVITTIEGLRLSKAGVLKEFPDLKDDRDWRLKAIQRFKEKIKTIPTEDKTIEYVKEELIKFGWTPLIKQRAGWRPIKYK